MSDTQSQQNQEVIAAIEQIKSDVTAYQVLVAAYVTASQAALLNVPADPAVAAALADLQAADAAIVAGEPLVSATQVVQPASGDQSGS